MKNYLFIAFILLSSYWKGQELARRPFLGISMEKITEDTKRIMALPSMNGVLINKVIEGSTAEKAGFLKGDVLLKINGKEINLPEEGTKTVASYRGGDDFNYEVIRAGKTIKGKSKFQAMATEKYPDITMHYTATKTSVGVQRLIISQPKNKTKAPALIFIGGIGCYSLDSPMDTTRTETRLLNSLTRAGYVCVRAEKPGVGDNTLCKPCSEISFKEEMDGYVNGINTLKKYDYVDSNNIYIIGHSMGGVMAPLVAQYTNVKGIIAYGTIGSSFIEYLLKTRRTIGEAYNWPQDEIDDYVKESCECAGYYFVERMTTEQAAAKREICRDYLSVFDYRSRKYNDELYELNIPSLWKKYPGKALLLWGEGDYIASKEDHEIITKTVNHYHEGNAKFEVVAKSTHGIQNANSFQDARTNPTGYNNGLAIAILKWLKET